MSTCRCLCVTSGVGSGHRTMWKTHARPRSQKPSPVCPVLHSLGLIPFSDRANARLSAGNQSSVRPTSETLVEAVVPALRRLGVPGANPRALRRAPVRRGWCQGGERQRSLPTHLCGRRPGRRAGDWTRAEGTCLSSRPAGETEGFPKQASCLISPRSQGWDSFRRRGERGGLSLPHVRLRAHVDDRTASPCLRRVWLCARRLSW